MHVSMYGIKVFGVALWVPQTCFLEMFSKCEGFEFGPFVMIKLSPILMCLMVALASIDSILKGGSLASDEITSSATRSVSCHNTSVPENCEGFPSLWAFGCVVHVPMMPGCPCPLKIFVWTGQCHSLTEILMDEWILVVAVVVFLCFSSEVLSSSLL